MIPENRYQKILELLKQDGAVKASDLAEQLGTSYETIRRDLAYLDKQGVLRRTSGGAVPIGTSLPAASIANEYVNFHARSEQHVLQKMEIARMAIRYISEGDVIALDSGSTALSLARLLRENFRHLTIVTNSLQVANEVCDKDGFTLIMTGGVYRADEGAFIVDSSVPVLSQLVIKTFFMTMCGLSVDKGVTYQRMDEIPIQMRLLEHSDKAIAITDSSKLGSSYLVKMCGIDRISCIITDYEATEEQIKPFIDAEIPVVKS